MFWSAFLGDQENYQTINVLSALLGDHENYQTINVLVCSISIGQYSDRKLKKGSILGHLRICGQLTCCSSVVRPLGVPAKSSRFSSRCISS